MKKIIYYLSGKLNLTIAFLLFTNFLFACGNVDKDKTTNSENYKNTEFGWEMPIPSGWQKMDNEKVNRMLNKGKSAFEKSTNTEVEDIDATKQLLYLEKGLNNFGSNITKIKEEEFQEFFEMSKEIINKTFSDNGFNVQIIENSDVEIDGVNFKHITYHLTFDNNNLVQDNFFTYRNGYFFTVSTTCYNDEEKKEIEKAFLTSKFTK